ncbi:MAG TPA: protein kinase [Vicinamibacterales bacterium]|nr:protein kinase [Vicinamibacterales bacterium]
MALTSGTRLGPYEVLAKLGEGGMGEVYRARDTKLQRDVAIKILPELASADGDRVARFTREAQLLAALNHPNIAQIFGLEATPDGHALVMELVAGDTLTAVIARDSPRGLHLDDALAIARQIADALEAAHEKSIIHRDMKPGNVMVTPDGQVKVLDFGLGKALESEAPGAASNSPTMTVRATQAGMILGTAGYMSPEQAKGRAADRRSDVWAFGCILFEMLAGRRAFEGEDVSDTLANILRGEPDWTALPPNLSPAIRTLIERCLVKDRTRRISDISTAKFLLNEPASLGSTAAGMSARAREPRSIRPSQLVAGMIAAAAIGAAVMWVAGPSPSPSSPAAVARVSVVLPAGAELEDIDIAPFALSPDGSMLAFTAYADGKVMLYQRALAEAEAKVLAGTDGAQMPFFSFDSKWIGFFANGQLKKVAVGGGVLEALCPAQNGRGGTWGEDGQIYFAQTNRTGIWRIAASGGAPTEFTQLKREAGEVSHRWPQTLPGHHLIYTVWTGPGPDEKSVVMRTAAGEQITLVRGGDRGRFAAPGYLVYSRGDSLMALAFDPAKPDLSGAVPVRLPGPIRGDSTEAPAFEVSAAGLLATLPAGPDRVARRIVWVDETGRTEALPPPAQAYEHVSISPDGKRAVVQIMEGVVNLWMYDFERGALTPFVKAGSSSQAPVWTHDSQRVIYRATRKGFRNLYWRAADGTGDEERLTTKDGVNQTPQSVSPDGKWAIFSELGGDTGGDVWRVSLDTGHRVELLVSGPSNQGFGVVSPGGDWLAYVDDDSGRNEIYLRPFPGPGPRAPISKDGGIEPRWSRDGRKLYFVTGDKFMVSDLTWAPSFTASVPRQLYQAPFLIGQNGATPFTVASDGRFLRVQLVKPDPPPTRIDIVINWRDELARLVK